MLLLAVFIVVVVAAALSTFTVFTTENTENTRQQAKAKILKKNHKLKRNICEAKIFEEKRNHQKRQRTESIFIADALNCRTTTEEKNQKEKKCVFVCECACVNMIA